MADYVFYRAFDVGNCTILDKMVDKVGGLDGMCLSSLGVLSLWCQCSISFILME